MSVAILSIKKKFSDAIFSGTKRCELRRSPFPKNINFVIVYTSSDSGLITGWFTVKTKLELSPKEIWKRFSREAYIEKDEFDKYYEGAGKGVCLVIDHYQQLNPPIDPSRELENFVAPQSFMYLKASDWPIFESRIPALKEQTLERHFGSIEYD